MSAPRRTRKTIMKSIRIPHETDQIITLLSQQSGSRGQPAPKFCSGGLHGKP